MGNALMYGFMYAFDDKVYLFCWGMLYSSVAVRCCLAALISFVCFDGACLTLEKFGFVESFGHSREGNSKLPASEEA